MSLRYSESILWCNCDNGKGGSSEVRENQFKVKQDTVCGFLCCGHGGMLGWNFLTFPVDVWKLSIDLVFNSVLEPFHSHSSKSLLIFLQNRESMRWKLQVCF